MLVLLAAFAVFGAAFGVWQVLLPDLKLALALSDGQLGGLLTVGFAATFPAMLVATRAIDRVGTRVLMVFAGSVLGLGFVVFSTLPSVPVLAVILLVWFAASGAYDIAINRAAVDLERSLGRRILTPLHAAFSLGAASGAAVTGVVQVAWRPFPATYLLVPPAVALVLLLVFARAPPGRTASADARRPSGTRRVPVLLLLLGVAIVAATVAEGALENWSAIYLRLVLGFPLSLGVLGVVGFHLAMGVGRLVSGRVIARIGRRATLARAGLLVAVATPLTLLASDPLPVLAGLLAVAAGVSVIFPIAVSLGGDRALGGSTAIASGVIAVGYAGFLIGPIVIGALSELLGLRVALLVVAGAGIAALAVSRLGLAGRGTTPRATPTIDA